MEASASNSIIGCGNDFEIKLGNETILHVKMDGLDIELQNPQFSTKRAALQFINKVLDILFKLADIVMGPLTIQIYPEIVTKCV